MNIALKNVGLGVMCAHVGQSSHTKNKWPYKKSYKNRIRKRLIDIALENVITFIIKVGQKIFISK